MNAAQTARIRFEDLLALEDTPEILHFRCPESGTLLWPVVRQPVMRFILGDLVYGSAITPSYAGRPLARAVLATLRALTHNFRRRSLRGEVLVAGTGMGHVQRAGRAFNRISDYFAEATPGGAVVVEDLFQWRWPQQRWNDRVLYHTPIQLSAFLRERIAVRSAHTRAAREFVDFLRSRASKVPWTLDGARAAFLELKLARYMAQSVGTIRAYRALLRRVRPQVVLKEEGCYGHSALFNVVARDAGLPSAEHQHGMVSATHDAYNVAPALAADPAYRATLPDTFLAYGDWWSEQINVPCARIAIGNPHRTAQLERLAAAPRAAEDVLVLGDGIGTQGSIDMSRSLARALSGRLRVVFRPHPLERMRLSEIAARGEREPFTVDSNADIYDSMLRAAAVVGEISTGLVESAGIVDRIFVWQTPKSLFVFPKHPFAVCESAEDLAERLARPDEGRIEFTTLDRIWAPDWGRRYLAFLETVGAASR